MVTTIKITCDGVFIQSNSYLSSSHNSTTPAPLRRIDEDRVDRDRELERKFTISFLNTRHPKLLSSKKLSTTRIGNGSCGNSSDSSVGSSGVGCSCDSSSSDTATTTATNNQAKSGKKESDIIDSNNNNNNKVVTTATAGDLYIALTASDKVGKSEKQLTPSLSVLSNTSSSSTDEQLVSVDENCTTTSENIG